CSAHRPVPLWPHMLVGKRMFDLFHDAEAAQKHDVHPELLRYTREMLRRVEGDSRNRGGRGRGVAGGGASSRNGGRGGRGRSGRAGAEIVEGRDREGLLPAIQFIFSRA